MEHKKYNRFNFYKHTFCEFQEVLQDSIKGLKLAYTSKSGSSYYFTDKGVYRVSNHWGRAANCRWRLISKEEKVNQYQRIGYAKWTDFYPNNETENLFYIEVNWKAKSVIFQHKKNPNFNNEVLRNASDTAKRIKQIKDVLKDDSWTKYLEFNDLEAVRKNICNQLIATNKSLIEIKQHYK
ncbi:hypothetical protein [Flavobacterium okayamense]|uniref:Uncharacterized protein n=1 Tax=Flavobacterium okayamense TaxID=2830782 RepID=A0ABM7S6F2_9FLAO|nr:hypothetical protein [Flavobacterium okayamense]BCY28924.1 hypothetical protein KK2020170_17920 [Flavobacterium okayamense]